MRENKYKLDWELLKDLADKVPENIDITIHGGGGIFACWENSESMVFELEDQEDLDAVLLAQKCKVE